MKGRIWASMGSVVAAIASSACCWLPLSAATLGLGMGDAAVLLERYRLPIVALTIVLLGLGFYFNYRPRRQCAPDDPCATADARWTRLSRGLLWISTIVVLAFVALPWAQPFMPTAFGGGAGPDVHGGERVVALSPDAHELRDAFNHDRGSMRILALLSPT